MSDHNYINESNEIDLKEILFKYYKYWKFYLITIITVVILAYFYLAFKENQYSVQSTILVKDDKKSGISSEISAFEDLGIGFGLGSQSSNIENVIEVLKSRYIVEKVIKENNLNIKYFEEVSFKNIQISKSNSPLTISLLDDKINKLKKSKVIDITNITQNNFTISIDGADSKTANFGEAISHKEIGSFIITPLKNKQLKGNNFKVILSPVSLSVRDYQSRLKIDKVNKESTTVKLSLNCQNVEIGKLFINELIKTHSEDEIKDKNRVSKNTILFINDRIKFITKELSSVESNVSNYKSQNDFFDLNENANIFFENQSKNKKELFENETQIKLAEFIYSDIKNKNIFDLVPSNLGLSDVSIEKSIESINDLLLERNKVASTSSEKNPVVISLDNQIKTLKNNLNSSLNNFINSLKIKNKELLSLNSELNSRLNNAPKQEKDFREILRQQQIKETLYLYLLKKREETSISYAVAVSNTKVIDEAYSDEIPVSPKKKIVYLGALLLGLILPTGGIYLKYLMDTKVKTKKELDAVNLPYLGDIPLSKQEEKIVVRKGDRSSTSEGFRLLRTNISFIKKNQKDVKNIFVTSTVSKEGKSFVSLNLAATYGLSGKKVLLIGMDLRAPKILEYLDINTNKGVSNYLVSEIQIEDLIIDLKEVDNVSVIPSGPIPPNPSELLNSEKLKELFDYANENFDVVIVDTAPVGLVTDTLQIANYADMFIYVVKANYLDKRMLHIPETLYKDKKLPNMVTILNGSDHEKGYGYGYGYGYGLEEEKKSFFSKIFKRK